MPDLPSKTGGSSIKLSKSGPMVSAALEKIPPEAVFKVIDVVGDVIRANKSMEGKALEHEQLLQRLKETNLDRKERMGMLSNLLLQFELNEEAQMRLVDSICSIAEGN